MGAVSMTSNVAFRATSQSVRVPGPRAFVSPMLPSTQQMRGMRALPGALHPSSVSLIVLVPLFRTSFLATCTTPPTPLRIGDTSGNDWNAFGLRVSH